MTLTVEASIVDGDAVTLIDPATATFFDLLTGTTAGPQIAPKSEHPIPDPISGALLEYLDGVVIGSTLNGLEGTGTIIAAGGFGLLTDPSDINLAKEAMTVVFTYEQSDGTQLVVRAAITAGSGPTLQEFVDGYSLENLLTDADTVNGSPYTFENSEDDFTGGTDADHFVGTDENDVMTGAGGADTLLGGLGDDAISGGTGADRLRGGAGNDDINGGAGADLLGGGRGRDTLDGGEGNDKLFGGSGHDELIGGAGNDRILGGRGNDTATGGEGSDVFVF
ncbi:calcium-binding protein, partial [Phaeobacter sp. JH20_09]